MSLFDQWSRKEARQSNELPYPRSAFERISRSTVGLDVQLLYSNRTISTKTPLEVRSSASQFEVTDSDLLEEETDEVIGILPTGEYLQANGDGSRLIVPVHIKLCGPKRYEYEKVDYCGRAVSEKDFVGEFCLGAVYDANGPSSLGAPPTFPTAKTYGMENAAMTVDIWIFAEYHLFFKEMLERFRQSLMTQSPQYVRFLMRWSGEEIPPLMWEEFNPDQKSYGDVVVGLRKAIIFDDLDTRRRTR
jgi:hypothetical protein